MNQRPETKLERADRLAYSAARTVAPPRCVATTCARSAFLAGAEAYRNALRAALAAEKTKAGQAATERAAAALEKALGQEPEPIQ